MTTILFIILIFFLIIFFIAWSIPFLGTATIIGYVIKNSLQKKTPEFLHNEKIKMEEKVNDLKEKIENWHKFTVNDITNNIQFTYIKAMSNKLWGRIYSQNNLPIIAFQRIDRGIYTNSRILASSTEFKIYFEYSNNENLVFFNDTYFGKIVNNSVILNSINVQIGKYNRNVVDSQNNYLVEFGAKQNALIFKNADRKNFITNPRFTRVNDPIEAKRSIKNYRETPQSNSLVNISNELSGEELKWIIAISVFESIYYGFEFTS